MMTRILGVAILAAGCAFFQAVAADQKVPLSPKYKTWLEEEVLYIIMPIERQVFQKLTTDRERDLFIEAFWKQRDPTPGTPENEFRTEHARRIVYANKNFHRPTPLPGWRTDRGRIYIILGEPNDIERYSGQGQVNSSEVWFYQDKTALGLPSSRRSASGRGAPRSSPHGRPIEPPLRRQTRYRPSFSGLPV